MRRALVIGFGNVYRRDDGVGRAVVNTLRAQTGRPPLDPLDDGFEELGGPLDALALHQLTPELAETLADYDLVIFVDAHTGEFAEPLREERLTAAYHPPLVSHQTHPAALLELARRLGGRAPAGVLLSLRGHDFDFGEGLSPETAALLPQALARVRALVE